ncbi:MAG: peptidase M22 [Clostridia bacterium]|nr:peptidase M22 [Clostridia bacterium]
MNKEKVVVAFDTSNYTTSVAVIGVDGRLIANLKHPLVVREGHRGIRQADAVFLHTVNLPVLMREARKYIDGKEVVAVGVSEKPRNVQGSYMPCFLTGVSAAESFAAPLCVPVYRFSHQCGHIMAVIYSSGRHELADESFAALHISGGTTELLRVTPLQSGFETEIVGGTLDLNAGQVIDRVGVNLGLRFPCGNDLEKLALTNTAKIPKRKISGEGMAVNLSGLENMALKLYEDTKDAPLTAAFVFDYIGNAVSNISEAYIEKYGDTPFVYAGGVMCNSLIKNKLSEKFDAAFAEPALSCDNAVGVAMLALTAYKAERGL